MPEKALAVRQIAVGAVFALGLAALLAALALPLRSFYVFYAGLYDGRLPALAFIAATFALMAAAFAAAGRGVQPSTRSSIPLLFVAAVALALITAKWVLSAFANSADEYAFVFQALTYASGRLWNPAPPLGQALASDFTWVRGEYWAGQYPPGWPILLSLAELVRVPLWAVNALVEGGTLVALAWLVQREAGEAAASPALAFFALAPFTIFTAASFHSHMLAAALIVLAALSALRMLETRSLAWAAATGSLVGLVATTRYIAAPLALAPIVAALLSRRGTRKPALLLALLAGGAPFLAILLAYHAAITGDPLKPAYWLAGHVVDRLYFDWPSIESGLRLTRDRLIELSLWTSPAVLPLWLAALWTKLRSRSFAFYDAVFPLFVLVFVFYPFDGGNRFGPRYYFDAWPLLVASIATALPHLDLSRRALFRGALILGAVYGLVSWPFLAVRYHAIVAERNDLYDQVAQMKLDKAVVFVKADTGVMLPMTCDDLARNGIDAAGPVLYARCDLTDPDAVAAAFPERSVWIYTRDHDVVRGTLTRVR